LFPLQDAVGILAFKYFCSSSLHTFLSLSKSYFHSSPFLKHDVFGLRFTFFESATEYLSSCSFFPARFSCTFCFSFRDLSIMYSPFVAHSFSLSLGSLVLFPCLTKEHSPNTQKGSFGRLHRWPPFRHRPQIPPLLTVLNDQKGTFPPRIVPREYCRSGPSRW